MTFDEWWNNWSVKDWNDIESAKNLFQQAFEAGQEGKVVEHFEAYGQCRDSRRIAELEKEIKSLGERCLQLQKDKGELIDELTKKSDTNHQLVEQLAKLNERCSELEAQIEKMKCCGNCAKRGHICVAEEMQGKLCGKNKDKWQLRR